MQSPGALWCWPQGENAWVFVNEEEIAETVKAYFKFEEDLFVEAKKQAAKNVEVKRPTEVSCAVMSGQYLSPAEVSFAGAGWGTVWAKDVLGGQCGSDVLAQMLVAGALRMAANILEATAGAAAGAATTTMGGGIYNLAINGINRRQR